MANKNSQRLIGPAVRLLLNKYGLKNGDVEATGPKMNLLKGDVLQHAERARLEPIREERSHVSALSPESRRANKSVKPKGAG